MAQHFFENGNLSETSRWSHGMQNGRAYKFYESGQVMYKANYEDSISVDTSYFYFENGKLAEKKIYAEGGKTIYLLKYDKSGEKLADLVLPIIDWGKDSIDIGEPVEISLRYTLPISGKIMAEFGYSKAKLPLIRDTIISGGLQINFCLREN